ncbi:hypothetical protein [Arthrobacter sp. Soil762]|uniref:hypothetical protein n=1 Tax=Arthrobacter sp. Soil762 TaxID=1736401 RepID=UPI0006FED1A0|nr:hypothetical protein [Arthrobacter sp. Soil762]KRE76793.1 hypothetical protein ASG77_19385 [Arthrobacter sp. Soil762]
MRSKVSKLFVRGGQLHHCRSAGCHQGDGDTGKQNPLAFGVLEVPVFRGSVLRDVGQECLDGCAAFRAEAL